MQLKYWSYAMVKTLLHYQHARCLGLVGPPDLARVVGTEQDLQAVQQTRHARADFSLRHL